MSKNIEGKFLVAPPHMRDERFKKTVIYLWKHDVTGSAGVIINKPLESPNWSDVCQEGNIVSAPSINPVMFWGGPVMSSVIGCLHSMDYSINQTNTNLSGNNIGFTMDKSIINAIAQNKGPKQYITTLGIVSWDIGQLEEELDALPPRKQLESWLILDFDPNLLWSGENPELWNSCVNSCIFEKSREYVSKFVKD
jgi:putative transcriptional regulator